MKKAQAKARRHIYGSGAAGCGGKAEPTNAKNTGQPIPCPFCERIFKQDGRLKEHLKSKHADQDPASVPQAGPASAAPESGANATQTAGTVAMPETGRAETKAAYHVKTPKMLLSEWCQKNKRPAPRYKHVEVEAGGFHCRLVLADPRDATKDAIFWYRESVCASAMDADNRAAVMGLHWVMGDRRMDRVLEEEFRGQWKELDVAMEERRERERRREAQKPRPLGPRRELQPVFMSEHNRRIVEELVRNGTNGAARPEEAGEADQWGTEEEDFWDGEAGEGEEGEGEGEEDGEDRSDRGGSQDRDRVGKDGEEAGASGSTREAAGERQVEADGALGTDGEIEDWEREDGVGGGRAAGEGSTSGREPGGRCTADIGILDKVRGGQGLRGVHPGLRHGSAASQEESEQLRLQLRGMGFRDESIRGALAAGSTLSEALDWLVLHVAEEELPTSFAPEASKAHIQVGRRGGRQQGEGPSGERLKQAAQRLSHYGYPLEEARSALFSTNGDEPAALRRLFRDLADGVEEAEEARQAAGTFEVRKGPEEEEEMREEERVVLGAIYGEDALELSKTRLALRLPGVPGIPGRLTLEILTPPGCRYPLELPVLAFTGQGLNAHFVAALTGAAAGRAWKLLGNCMAYELACFATEEAPALWQRYSRGLPGASSLAEGSAAANGRRPTVTGGHEKGGHRGRGDGRQSSQGRGMGVRVGLGQAKQRAVERVPSRDGPVNASGSDSGRNRSQASGPSREPITTSDEACNRSPVITFASQAPSDRQEGAAEGSVLSEGAQEAARLESLKLVEEWRRWQQEGRFGAMRSQRARLPAFKERRTLLQAIASGPVTVVCGQTGCGKSTQVPQYVLEDAIEKGHGGLCNIICTQPRRISAIGLADRVAQERGEAVGTTVGYSIRLESKRSVRTRLLFCTAGILLRRLLGDPELRGVSHVVLDEVHERSVDGDLLLLLLRALLQRQRDYGSRGVGLKVILMSATVDADLFARYFEAALGVAAQVATIPGFTHPVRELFLEDALELTGFRIGRGSKYALKKPPGKAGEASGGADSAGKLAAVADTWETMVEEESGGGKGGVGRGVEYSESTRQSLSVVNEEVLNYELIEGVVYHILLDSQRPSEKYGPLIGPWAGAPSDEPGQKGPPQDGPGAVLVFLPGMAEIRRLQSTLQGSRRIAEMSGGKGLWILPLHGSLSGEEQRRVFARPPPGVHKVVLATNIAETSITIDDVVFVIDSGRVKEMQYEHARGMACLVDSWVSQASAGQRRGRAGRVQPGCCLRLLSRRLFARLPPQQQPEMLRVPLEGLCLQVKSLLPGMLEDVLAQALSPPSPPAVTAAIKSLRNLQALSAAEELTPLGCHLAKMPLDARLGKMLIFGCMLRCLDPILTVAAAVSGRPPFVSPMDRRNEANAAKQRLAGSTKSDHLAIVAAFDGFLRARDHSRDAEREYCESNFLSREALVAIAASRVDYASVLVDLGFASSEYHRSLQRGAGRLHDREGLTHPLDANSGNVRVVKAVLCAGLYPNIVRVQHPETIYAQQHTGTVAKDAAPHEIRFYTKDDGRVFLHPSSVNFVVGKFESPWLVYGEKVQTSKVYVREGSMVPAYALLLFGGTITVEHVKQVIRVDAWMEFQAPARIAVLIKELRTKVDEALARKIDDVSLDISSMPVVTALVQLLKTDGF